MKDCFVKAKREQVIKNDKENAAKETERKTLQTRHLSKQQFSDVQGVIFFNTCMHN